MRGDTNLEKLISAIEHGADSVKLTIEVESIGTQKRKDHPAASRLITVTKTNSSGKLEQLAAWAGAGYREGQHIEDLAGNVMEELALKALGGDLEREMTGTQTRRRRR